LLELRTQVCCLFHDTTPKAVNHQLEQGLNRIHPNNQVQSMKVRFDCLNLEHKYDMSIS